MLRRWSSLSDSLEQGEIPNFWKLANISPIYKKGSKILAENYRPVSLTSAPCRILESMIRDRILDHLNHNAPITKKQHGFVKGKSCTTNLIETLDEITKSLDKRVPVDVIYLDFAKAFDSVPHRRLLLKLEKYGIDGRLLEWIRSFLSNRNQRVVQGKNLSSWKDVWSGVPQCSVLSPLLFLIYINYLADQIRSSLKLFADDVKLISSLDSANKQLIVQDDLNTITNWSEAWLIKFNVNKCKVMHFGLGNSRFEYVLRDNNLDIKLTKSELEKDLGVYISSNLKWKDHVNFSSSKANQILGILKRTFSYLDIKTVKL